MWATLVYDCDNPLGSYFVCGESHTHSELCTEPVVDGGMPVAGKHLLRVPQSLEAIVEGAHQMRGVWGRHMKHVLANLVFEGRHVSNVSAEFDCLVAYVESMVTLGVKRMTHKNANMEDNIEGMARATLEMVDGALQHRDMKCFNTDNPPMPRLRRRAELSYKYLRWQWGVCPLTGKEEARIRHPEDHPLKC